jgi:hypothetical protein
MLLPSAADTMFMLLDQSFDYAQIAIRQSIILRYFDGWLNPELGFAVARNHMYVHSRFFSGEKEKPKLSITKYRGAHKTSAWCVVTSDSLDAQKTRKS